MVKTYQLVFLSYSVELVDYISLTRRPDTSIKFLRENAHGISTYKPDKTEANRELIVSYLSKKLLTIC
jgi:hypothetical protein